MARERVHYDVILLGTGRLAWSLMQELPIHLDRRRSVLMLGRSQASVDGILTLARARLAALGHSLRLDARVLDIDRRDAVRALFERLTCGCVVVAMSSQSPQEKRERVSGWTDMLHDDGFGLSVPFNAYPAACVADALDRAGSTATLVNGAFPDAVNALLAGMTDRPILGIGNVATIAYFLQGAESAATPERLRLIAHHAHLSAPRDPGRDLRLWRGHAAVPHPGATLHAMRALPRERLNHLAGLSGARTVATLIERRSEDDHVPGPFGLPGGYPVTLAEGTLRLDLPEDVDMEAAVALNCGYARLDGIADIHDGRITFTDALRERMRRRLPEFPDSVEAGDLDSLCHSLSRFESFRRQLREMPACVPGTTDIVGLDKEAT